MLREATVDSVRSAVVGLAGRSAEELAAMTRRGWTWVRAHHTRERFSAEYRRSVVEIVSRFRPELARRLELAA